MKQISRQEAHDKYGVNITGVNSLYRYYLTDDGCVIDSDGDLRYIPIEQREWYAVKKPLLETLNRQGWTVDESGDYLHLQCLSAHRNKYKFCITKKRALNDIKCLRNIGNLPDEAKVIIDNLIIATQSIAD